VGEGLVAEPEGLGRQLPADPGSAHDEHSPAQDVSQQTPSTQKLELQSVAARQDDPLGCLLPHLLPVHAIPF
jgi:hypothetical protein